MPFATYFIVFESVLLGVYRLWVSNKRVGGIISKNCDESSRKSGDESSRKFKVCEQGIVSKSTLHKYVFVDIAGN